MRTMAVGLKRQIDKVVGDTNIKQVLVIDWI